MQENSTTNFTSTQYNNKPPRDASITRAQKRASSHRCRCSNDRVIPWHKTLTHPEGLARSAFLGYIQSPLHACVLSYISHFRRRARARQPQQQQQQQKILVLVLVVVVART